MSRAKAVVARVRDEPRVQDWLIAGVFLVVGVREPFVLDIGTQDRLIAAATAVPIAGGLLWRRTNPVAATVAFSFVALAYALLAEEAFSNATVLFIALFFYFYAVGAYGDPRRSIPSIAVAAAVLVATIPLTGSGEDVVGGLVFVPLFIGIPMLVGHSLQSRRRLARELEE